MGYRKIRKITRRTRVVGRKYVQVRNAGGALVRVGRSVRPYISKYTTFLKSVGTLSTSAGGVIQAYYDDDASGTTDWTSFGNLFDQYRIVAMKITFLPTNINNDTGINNWRPIYVLFDPDSTGNGPSTADTCLQYEGCKALTMNKPFTYYHRIPKITSLASGSSAITSGGWRDIASPAATCGIKVYADGLSASMVYASIITRFYVQFRHRR